jgi:hypothetical protein
MKTFTEIMEWVVGISGVLVVLALAAAGIGLVVGFCFAVARATFKFWN